ncbi:MAG: putative porin [Pyrinomonadaceae bacterium]
MFRMRPLSIPGMLALLVLLVVPVSHYAQAEVARAGNDPNVPPATKPDADIAHKLELLEEQLRAQNGRIDQLTALVTEQQRLINQLVAARVSNPTTVAGTSAPGAVASATEPGVSTTADAAAQNPSEDRIKKLEERVLKFGPFRFSGDFRLRFDGTFRRAEPNPPAGFAPLTHAQNVRMRYRFRFNFDTDINSKLSFHGQLSTGAITDPLSADQDFAQTGVKHPFFISEAWIDYHPNKQFKIQAGRVQEIFADNSKFMFDDDLRLNGFNEQYVFTFKNNSLHVSSLELRAGQYFLTNPNVAIVTPGSPLAQAGAVIGSTGRAAQLFHQGLLLNQKYNDRWSSQIGGDVQVYRNPNQIQLPSTANGVAIIVQNGLGIALSGPISGTGNATTTPGGAIYTARNFHIARLTYRLNWAGFQKGGHDYPVTFNLQAARNVGIGLPERDAMLAALQVGRTTKRGDMAFLYVFSIKGANALISQFTDNDLGTGSGVNIRTHHFRFDYAFNRKVTWQSLFYIQNQLRNSGQFPNFFVPLNAFTPRQYRWQEQLVFTF